MIINKKFLLVVFSCLSALASAQESAFLPVQFRAVLHDPINPAANFFVSDSTGTVIPLELRTKDLSRPMISKTVNGSLVLYDKQAIDPKKPGASLAATCAIPTGAKRGIVIILPSPAGSKPAYRMLFIDDSAKAFPLGESRILTLLPVEAAIEAGEHKLPIHPGEIARLPLVKKVDNFNMAQTNFFYKKEQEWTVFTERKIQYLDAIRRIFIVYVTPEALQPSADSITDTTSPTAPLLTR
jgi:hypothetical protein